MVHPYMYMLKQMFTSKIENNKIVDTYLDLIYGSLITYKNMRKDEEEEEENIEEESDNLSFTNDDNDIPTAEN